MKKLIWALVFVLFFSACEPLPEIVEQDPGAYTEGGTDLDTAEVDVVEAIVEPDKPLEEEMRRSLSPDGAALYADAKAIVSPHGLCYNLTKQELVYAKDIDATVYPASITKLLTALVAEKYATEYTVFTVGSEIELIQEGSSVAQLKEGQALDLQAVLTALLTPSGNDAAYTIAVNIAAEQSSVDSSNSALVANFVELMNAYAKELSLTGSHFQNPDGYHHENHYSTVRDLLKISQAAAESPLISEICAAAYPEVTYLTGEVASWQNTNPLMYDTDYHIYGLKTGFTDEAGFCFAGIADVDGQTYITIVTGSEDREVRESDTKQLLWIGQHGYVDGAIQAYIDEKNEDDAEANDT